jgi:hypothetical protein
MGDKQSIEIGGRNITILTSQVSRLFKNVLGDLADLVEAMDQAPWDHNYESPHSSMANAIQGYSHEIDDNFEGTAKYFIFYEGFNENQGALYAGKAKDEKAIIYCIENYRKLKSDKGPFIFERKVQGNEIILEEVTEQEIYKRSKA